MHFPIMALASIAFTDVFYHDAGLASHRCVFLLWPWFLMFAQMRFSIMTVASNAHTDAFFYHDGGF